MSDNDPQGNPSEPGPADQPNWGNVPPTGHTPPPGQYPPAGGYPPQGQTPPPAQYPPPGGYPPPGQYPPPAAYPPAGYQYAPAPAAPKHEQATTAMILGIVSLVGAFVCFVPVVLGPFAWYMGAKAKREIEDSRGALSGLSEAKGGMVTGIIATVLMILGLMLIGLLIVLTIADPTIWDEEVYESSWDAAASLLPGRG